MSKTNLPAVKVATSKAIHPRKQTPSSHTATATSAMAATSMQSSIASSIKARSIPEPSSSSSSIPAATTATSSTAKMKAAADRSSSSSSQSYSYTVHPQRVPNSNTAKPKPVRLMGVHSKSTTNNNHVAKASATRKPEQVSSAPISRGIDARAAPATTANNRTTSSMAANNFPVSRRKEIEKIASMVEAAVKHIENIILGRIEKAQALLGQRLDGLRAHITVVEQKVAKRQEQIRGSLQFLRKDYSERSETLAQSINLLFAQQFNDDKPPARYQHYFQGSLKPAPAARATPVSTNTQTTPLAKEHAIAH
eukprot:CAMPEP_0170174484 /NCGR_PEP_ID=MMETSP0040_2-20121228/7711_1 /TAXON_ID=641309 /ORGANISM="Lotharella oceanica, Strain CCMP622" /LENGTH=308 /DNA_ID=CAMNT_0010416139 /DNA_START=32 /DNA_END=958 /DNA_ORIENTATION=-